MTAMQELLKELKTFKGLCESNSEIFVIDYAISNTKSKIEKEKQQILNAYDSGNRKGYDEHQLSASADLDEEYYNNLFNNEPK